MTLNTARRMELIGGGSAPKLQAVRFFSSFPPVRNPPAQAEDSYFLGVGLGETQSPSSDVSSWDRVAAFENYAHTPMEGSDFSPPILPFRLSSPLSFPPGAPQHQVV